MKLGLLSTLILGAALVGCGTLGGITEERFGACPTATILADAADVTTFRAGSGRDLTDIYYQGAITNLETRCDYGRSGGTRYAWARLSFDVELELGSAAYPNPVNVPYFVVVVDPVSQTVLTKEVFSVNAAFGQEVRGVSIPERIGQVAIPVSDNTEGANYEIIIGFELTPEQVEFNRNRGH